MFIFDKRMDIFDFFCYDYMGGIDMHDATLFEKHTEIFNGDIGMYYCGKRIGTKNHIYGPEIRSHFLIVLVEKGTAVLYRGEKEFLFKDRDILVMFPGEKIFYKAQTNWTIQWIGVCGTQVEDVFQAIGVTREEPIFTPGQYEEISNVMSQLYDTEYDNSMFAKYKTQSLIYSFFSLLLKEKNEKLPFDPVNTALQIIKYNYNNNLNIKAIANSLFLDSAYFSRLFKSKVGLSPKQYILQTRIERAKELIITTNYHIKDISYTVGFNDSLYFSRIFYKTEGITPSGYREMHNKRN